MCAHASECERERKNKMKCSFTAKRLVISYPSKLWIISMLLYMYIALCTYYVISHLWKPCNGRLKLPTKKATNKLLTANHVAHEKDTGLHDWYFKIPELTENGGQCSLLELGLGTKVPLVFISPASGSDESSMLATQALGVLVTVVAKQLCYLATCLLSGCYLCRNQNKLVCYPTLVPSPPPQLSLLAVRITLFVLQVMIAAVENWERGYTSLTVVFTTTKLFVTLVAKQLLPCVYLSSVT